MNFTRIELHKSVAFDIDNLDCRRGWRTLYHREGRRSARQKTAQSTMLECGTYGFHAAGVYDCGRHECDDPFAVLDWDCCDWPNIYDCDIPTDSLLWGQISALKEYRS